MSMFFRSSIKQTGILLPRFVVAQTEGCFPNASVRYLSRMKTKHRNKGGFWIKKLAPPLYEKSLIQQKLEERPESRFETVGPPVVSHSSSVFFDPLIDRFTNMVMYIGLKESACEQMRFCFQKIKTIQLEKYRKSDDDTKPSIIIDPRRIFHMAVDNCKPVLALTPLKRGGVTYQIPVALTEKHAEWTAMKWLVLAGRDHPKGDQFRDALAYELVSAAQNQGKVIKRKYDLHKQCEANKAYAHYRWSR